MRALFAVAGLFALLASCGFDPQPKDGKLPCDNGCPSGYVCRADNHCWRSSMPAADSGVDVPAVVKDASLPEGGGVDGAISVDHAAPEAGKEVAGDSVVATDVGIAVDVADPDTGTPVDTGSRDGKDGSTVDAPTGAGGAGGGGGASGYGGAVGVGGSSGESASGGASGTGGTIIAGGTGGGAGGSAGTGGTTADASLGTPDAACVPETDEQLCARLGKNCDAISGVDNCGQSRSIASCGTCGATLVCGTFVANVCPAICIFDQSTFDSCVFGE